MCFTIVQCDNSFVRSDKDEVERISDNDDVERIFH